MMNQIFNANMQAIINRALVEPVFKHGCKLKKNSTSRRIIEYLFEHGKTSGAVLMCELNIKNSPKAYIQRHMRAGRVISDAVHIHKALYSINSQTTKEDFGL